MHEGSAEVEAGACNAMINRLLTGDSRAVCIHPIAAEKSRPLAAPTMFMSRKYVHRRGLVCIMEDEQTATSEGQRQVWRERKWDAW